MINLLLSALWVPLIALSLHTAYIGAFWVLWLLSKLERLRLSFFDNFLPHRQTDGQTQISIPWAPVGAKKILNSILHTACHTCLRQTVCVSNNFVLFFCLFPLFSKWIKWWQDVLPRSDIFWTRFEFEYGMHLSFSLLKDKGSSLKLSKALKKFSFINLFSIHFMECLNISFFLCIFDDFLKSHSC